MRPFFVTLLALVDIAFKYVVILVTEALFAILCVPLCPLWLTPLRLGHLRVSLTAL